MVFGRALQRVIGLIRPLILARLIAPEDFGILGIAIMTRLIVERLGISSGLFDALIRRDDLTREHYAAAWTFEIGRALVYGAVVVAIAPVIASFFGTPEATAIIRLMGLEIALLSFTSLGMIFVRKELDFKKEFYYKLIPNILGTAITIWLAFELRNVWALALGNFTLVVTQVVMSYVLAPYLLRPTWAPGKLRDLAGFAIWTSVSNLLSVTTSQVDRLFVGRILGPASLGLYVLAGRITNFVSHELSNGVLRVGFPAFAKIRQDERMLNQWLNKVIAGTMFLLGPLALYLGIWSHEIIRIVLGSKWLDAAPVVPILAAVAVVFALTQVYITVVRSLGRASIAASADFIKLVVMVSVAYPLISNLELRGAGFAVLAGTATSLTFILWRSRSLLPGTISQLFKSSILVGVLSSGLLVTPLVRSVDAFGTLESLVLGSLAFAAGYIAVSVVLYRLSGDGPWELVAQVWAKRRSKLASQS